jgi:hypothetical protein
LRLSSICGSTPLWTNHQGDVKISFGESVSRIGLRGWFFLSESNAPEQSEQGQSEHFLQDGFHIEGDYVIGDFFLSRGIFYC